MLNYQTMKIEDIIQWCKDNNQVNWLKAKAQEKKQYKVYPRKKVEVNGKIKSVVDKSQAPTVETRPISFVQLKIDFVNEFMPEIAPEKKDKKPNMFDMIAAL